MNIKLFIALSLFTLQVSAGEVSVSQCPQKMSIRQVMNDDRPVVGWKIVNSNGEQSILGIGISAGEYPTEQTGFEIPAGKKILPNGDVIYFHDELIPVKNEDDGSYVHDYWIVCGYVSSDTFLVQKLPENVVRCEVKKDRDPHNIAIKCFDTPRKTK